MTVKDARGVEHILIYSEKEDLFHKFRGPLDVDDRAYWTVSGTPQRAQRYCRIFFHDGDVIYGEGMVTQIEEGKIWFTPLESVRLDHPQRPDTPHQGFKYIEGLPVGTPPPNLAEVSSDAE